MPRLQLALAGGLRDGARLGQLAVRIEQLLLHGASARICLVHLAQKLLSLLSDRAAGRWTKSPRDQHVRRRPGSRTLSGPGLIPRDLSKRAVVLVLDWTRWRALHLLDRIRWRRAPKGRTDGAMHRGGGRCACIGHWRKSGAGAAPWRLRRHPSLPAAFAVLGHPLAEAASFSSHNEAWQHSRERLLRAWPAPVWFLLAMFRATVRSWLAQAICAAESHAEGTTMSVRALPALRS